MGVPKLVVGLLALVLIVYHSRQGSLVRGASNSNSGAAAATELPFTELSLNDQQQQQLQAVNHLSQGHQDNLKRYLLKDFNSEGYMQKQPSEQWTLDRLNELLDNWSFTIPTTTPPPIYRSGRTFPMAVAVAPTAGLSSNLQQQQQEFSSRLRLAPTNSLLQFQQSAAAVNGNGNGNGEQQQQQQQLHFLGANQRVDFDLGQHLDSSKEIPDSAGKSSSWRPIPILGIAWPPTKPLSTNPGFVNVRRLQASGQTSKGDSLHHTLGTEEIAVNPPMHSRSDSDLEWKRVENSRWNNLRGMWGKRAAISGETHFSGNFDESQRQFQ